MYISHPSMSTLTSIKVPILASHLHSSNISLAFRSHLNLIQVTIIASQLHLGANIPPFRFWGKLITSTQHSVSTPWGPLYIHLTSIQVESHTRPNPNKCVSSPTRSPLLHIRINSGLNRKPSGYQDVHLTCSCPTESISKYHYLIYIHVPFQLHAGPLYCISLPSRSHLSSIQTLSQTQPGFKICISSSSSSCPTLIQVSHFHPGPQIHISIPHLQFKCWDLPPTSV